MISLSFWRGGDESRKVAESGEEKEKILTCFCSTRVNFAPDNFHDCSLLDRTSLANHDMHLKRGKRKDVLFMEEQYKGHTLSESQQKRIKAHIRGNQFAE